MTGLAVACILPLRPKTSASSAAGGRRGVAQWVAHRVWDAGVGGSNPPTPTDTYRIPPTQREEAVRGQAVSPATKEADVVLVAARYGADGRVRIAQAYLRRGPIWGDLVLLDRGTLVEALQRGRKVFAGRTRDLSHDFELLHRLVLDGRDGEGVVRSAVAAGAAGRDELGVPLL